MATYTIKVYNQSTLNKSYVVFLQPPQVTANGGTTPIFTNAWRTFPNLTNGGWDSVKYTETTFAYWAQPPGVSAGTTVDSGGVIEVNTDTKDSTTFVYGEANGQPTGFLPVTSPGGAQNGSFEIITGTDFTPAADLVFGLASDNGSGIPSPIATFEAAPNEKYNVTPIVQFYVADGSFSEGAIIDVTTVSNNNALIDFTGTPFTTAIVTQGADGSFSVKYS
ncbi:hypothetical protein [Caulobacter sp. X]|uniref:hypothetical protein n=1 Tax=Caulobacter sp. X TaxID=2048901 RepID=UPI000C161B46|nr:hypothetical protein [Caulobacter sp. X]PIC00841.1 hypothetical protein CSW60_04615 [Caulobacter sp. X]